MVLERGRLRPGWPITVVDSSACELLMPVDDGSVRVVCDATDLPPPELDGVDARALAFDSDGQLMVGWPIELGPGHTARVVGDELALLQHMPTGDVISEGQPHDQVRIVAIATDGAPESGRPSMVFEDGCCQWEVGPDGVAYGLALLSGLAEGSEELSLITSIDDAGARAGWPVVIEGVASGPAFASGGQVVVTVGSYVRRTSRVLVFPANGKAAVAWSADLPIATGAVLEHGVDGPYECGVPSPRPPLVGLDGTTYVTSDIDTAVFALDLALEVKRGWPYRPTTPLVYRFSPTEELSCGSLALPAAGSDGTLYLPLRARDATVGGSLVAVGPDGRVRPGWPVVLQRPGSEFWSVVVGSDGTIHAMAVEPEAGDDASATILAIAPDSTVLHKTTIIEP